MNFKAFAFKTFFGGKPWYKSMVGWATVVITVSEVALPLIGELGLLDPELQATLQIKLRSLSAALGGLGIRRRLPVNGPVASALLACVLVMGCNTLTVQTVLPGGEIVTTKARSAGRGCFAIDTRPDGETNAIGSFDATSDWAGIRAVPLLVQTAITAFFGKPQSESVGMEGPSVIGGCDVLFTDEPEAGNDEPNEDMNFEGE